jgi:hypothetical protein
MLIAFGASHAADAASGMYAATPSVSFANALMAPAS